MLVVLTGAGISADSGVPTFRGPGGLWRNHRAEELATPEAFALDPGLVHAFYNERRRGLVDEFQPNAAHRALARLEREFAGELFLVTQNIDDLHERGGSERVVHMHGELLKLRCGSCGGCMEWREAADVGTPCPICGETGTLRPDVVWFGEMPRHMEEIEAGLLRAETFVAIGTSGRVYPAAGFVQLAGRAGARTIELNLVPSDTATLFDEAVIGRAAETVPEWVQGVLDDS